MTVPPPPAVPTRVTLCEPNPTCADPHLYRWYCMRGHALDDGEGVLGKAMPGVCPLRVCASSNPKERTDA